MQKVQNQRGDPASHPLSAATGQPIVAHGQQGQVSEQVGFDYATVFRNVDGDPDPDPEFTLTIRRDTLIKLWEFLEGGRLTPHVIGSRCVAFYAATMPCLLADQPTLGQIAQHIGVSKSTLSRLHVKLGEHFGVEVSHLADQKTPGMPNGSRGETNFIYDATEVQNSHANNQEPLQLKMEGA